MESKRAEEAYIYIYMLFISYGDDHSLKKWLTKISVIYNFGEPFQIINIF
jgi:hypothetical protein